MTQAAAPSDDDFFELLGLDPEAPWDQDAFEALWKLKTEEWRADRHRALGAKKERAQRAFALASRMKEELSDPAKRKGLIDRARSHKAGRKAEQRKALDVGIRVLVADKGFLYESERLELVKEFGSTLGETTVLDQCGTIEVRPDPVVSAAMETLDSTRAEEVARDLGLVGARSLYHFLLDDVNPIAEREPTTRLLEAAQRIYHEAGKDGNKSDRTTLRQKLAGVGLEFFENDARRSSYDATLRQARCASILRQADRAASRSRRLTASQVQILLDEAAAAGLDPVEAQAALTQHARGKWALEVPVLKSQKLCGCGKLNASDATFCAQCRQPLTIDCPRCSSPMSSAVAACTKCSHPVGRRFRVRELLDEARALLAAHCVQDAAQRLAEARAQWPVARDPLSAELDEIEHRATAARSELAQATHDVQHLIATTSFYAARAKIQALPSGDASLAELRTRVDTAIADAERRVQAIAARPASDDAVAKECLRILEACRDCEPARQRLAEYPPEPPHGLQSASRGHIVTLRWSAHPSSNVSFVVVRKARVRPQHAGDGHVVGTVRDCHCDDGSPEVGVDLFYAVFADRGGVTSRAAAHLETPVMVGAEVANLRAHVGDGEIRLEWRAPANVHRVFATRTATGGAGADARRLDSVDGRQIVDTSVVNDQPYRYTVRCEFTRTAGAPLVTPGSDLVAMAQKRPAAVEGFGIVPVEQGSSQALRLSWTPPPKGHVWILSTPSAPACRGNAIPARELKAHGEVLVASGAALTIPSPDSGVRYYTPLIVLGETAYVGTGRRYVQVDEVSHLQAQNLGDRIRVTWDWPGACAIVQVCVSGDGWPLDDDGTLLPHAARTRLARTEYDRHGWYELRSRSDRDLYVVVQTVTNDGGGEEIVAPGVRCQVRLRSRIRVEYELRKAGWFGGGMELKLTTDRRAELPPFRLVCKTGMPPRDLSDGECMLQQSRALAVDGTVRVPVTGVRSDGRSYAKLFLENDADYEWLTVFHPDREKLKV